MDQCFAFVVHREGDVFWIELPDFPEATTRGCVGTDDPFVLAEECLRAAAAFASAASGAMAGGARPD